MAKDRRRDLRDASAIPSCAKNLRPGVGYFPDDPDTLAVEAKIYQAEGNLKQAGKLLAEVNAQTPSLNAYLTKKDQFILERHFDEAIRLIHNRLTEYRDLPEIERLFDLFFLLLAQQYAGDVLG